MFVIDLSPSYFWPVKFSVPKADGTGHDRCEFEGEFARKTVDELNEMGTEAVRNGVSDIELSRRVLVGWRGVCDKSGNPVSFSTGALSAFLQIPGTGTATMQAFYESLVDKPAAPSAAAKN